MAPNWFTSVMGTGIVATAATSLPVHIPGRRAFAATVWVMAAVLFLALIAAAVRRPRAYHDDPVLVHYYGAPPMAALTVGAGALQFVPGAVGESIAWTLWTVGTLGGLTCAVLIPYHRKTRHPAARPGPWWLMPVVPPMVSAATGAALIPHAPAGQPRLTMLLACYAMFGVSLIAALALLPSIWRSLPHSPAPTVWIVLGPLGQSITAAGGLGRVAGDAPHADALRAWGLIYGVPVAGLAFLWGCLALALTVRRRPSFAPTWWSFTFPVGTCVTGVSALAHQTGSVALRAIAVLLYAGLVGTWAVVAARTVASRRSAIVNFLAPRPDAVRPVASTY